MQQMLDVQRAIAYKWQSRTVCSAPVRLLSNVHERMQQMPKPYFRSNYAEVKTQFEPPFDNCVCVPMTRGYHTIIDAEDFERTVGDYYWSALGYDNKRIYAHKRDKSGNPNIRLHRLIINAKSSQVDHINGNTLDNRKKNLRPCSAAQNQWNRKNQNQGGYKGVSWHKATNNWRVQIRALGEKIYLGCYTNKEEAARVYDAAALKYYGDFAKLNYPKEAAHDR